MPAPPDQLRSDRSPVVAVDAVSCSYGFDHRRRVPVSALSGGGRRRLDFAMALWGEPELIVLDEPTTIPARISFDMEAVELSRVVTVTEHAVLRSDLHTAFLIAGILGVLSALLAIFARYWPASNAQPTATPLDDGDGDGGKPHADPATGVTMSAEEPAASTRQDGMP